jgi:hypothetical protein
MGGRPLTIFACTIPTEGAPSLCSLQEPALSGAEGVGSDAADAAFVRSAQTPPRMDGWTTETRRCLEAEVQYLYFTPARFLLSIITLLKIRLIRVW